MTKRIFTVVVILVGLIGGGAAVGAEHPSPIRIATQESPKLQAIGTGDAEPPQNLKLALTEEERAWIAAHPVIRVAADPDYAPFQFRNEAGAPKGIANDLLDLVARDLGLRIEYIQPDSWAQALLLVQGHQADMVAVATETPERLQYLRFTAPYVEYPDIIITRAGRNLTSMEELKGCNLATIKSNAVNDFIREHYPGIKLINAPDAKSLLQMVSTGEMDGGVLNLATISYAIEKSKITNLHVNNIVGFSYKLAFASRRDWPMLNRLLDKALATVDEAERQLILRKWIRLDFKEKEPTRQISLTDEERQWLREHPVVLAASDPQWPPIEYLDGNGKLSGMVADYIALVERRLGIKIKMVPQKNWSAALESIRQGRVSLLTSAARTPERDAYLRFTEPYLELPAAIIVNTHTKGVSSMADLRGKRVAVVKDYSSHEFLRRGFPYLELVPVADVKSGLYEVSYGEVDAFVANIASASYYIEKYAIQNLRVAGESGYVYELGIASRKDGPMLNRLLKKGVAAITPKERQEIYRKWIGLKTESWKPTGEQLISLAILLPVLGLGGVLFWNRQLRSKVESRTREMQASEQKFRNLYKTAMAGLFRSSVDGTEVLAGNPALAQLFGYDAIEELLESFAPHDAYVQPCRRDDLLAAMRKNGKVDNFEFLGRRHDGSVRNFLLSATLYEEQGYIEGGILDITDRKKAEEEIAAARDAAEEASLAKSAFLAVMSHEIRSPLNAIIGLIDLTGKSEDHEKHREYIRLARGSADTLLALVNDILDLSKIESGRFEIERVTFEVRDLAEKIVESQRHLAEDKSLNLSLHIDDRVPAVVEGGEGAIRQVLLNLLNNAVKFTPRGEIVVRLGMAPR